MKVAVIGIGVMGSIDSAVPVRLFDARLFDAEHAL